MGCFWTDFVGCAEDCSDTPTIDGAAFVSTVSNHFGDFPDVLFWFGKNPDGGCWFEESPAEQSYNGVANTNRTLLTSAYVKRIDLVISTSSGCDYEPGDPPDWFPADAGACGCLVSTGSAEPSVDDLSLALTPVVNDDPGFSSKYGSSMKADIQDLWIAAGQAEADVGILYMEIVGDNGVHYYGMVVTDGCF